MTHPVYVNRYLFELRQRERANGIAEPVDHLECFFVSIFYSSLLRVSGVHLLTGIGICRRFDSILAMIKNQSHLDTKLGLYMKEPILRRFVVVKK